ncbi:hypothetical protein BDW62DRAFT_58043 [Aspergillus aurantiobrunneus]
MAEYAPVHFFDLRSDLPGPSKAWSCNTIKIRMSLNYKGIPYTQTYISYPDIAPLLRSLSVPPHPEGAAHTAYTLPAIQHSSGALMDSLPIARYLEEQYPERPLFPSGNASHALAVAVDKLMRGVAFAAYTYIFPPIADILDARGREFYIRTRSATFGKPFEEIRPTDEVVIRGMIENMKKEMTPIVQMLKGGTGKTGPFFEGDQPGFADFILEGFLIWFKIANEGIWQELIELGDGEVKALWDACYPWVEGQGENKDWEIPQ